MKLEKPWSTYSRRVNKFFAIKREPGEDLSTGLSRFLRDEEKKKPVHGPKSFTIKIYNPDEN